MVQANVEMSTWIAWVSNKKMAAVNTKSLPIISESVSDIMG